MVSDRERKIQTIAGVAQPLFPTAIELSECFATLRLLILLFIIIVISCGLKIKSRIKIKIKNCVTMLISTPVPLKSLSPRVAPALLAPARGEGRVRGKCLYE